MRRKDEEIAQLRAALKTQVTHKRLHSEKEIEDLSVLENAPRKLSRVGEGTRGSQIASRITVVSEGRRAEELPRSKAHITSRVQINRRNSDEDAVVKDKALSSRGSRSPPLDRRCAILSWHHARVMP